MVVLNVKEPAAVVLAYSATNKRNVASYRTPRSPTRAIASTMAPASL